MSEPGSITQLVNDLQNADPLQIENASTQIFIRYFDQLAKLATRHLSQLIRQRVDGEDVANSAMKSFFLRQENEAFHIQNREKLFNILSKITLNKVRSVARHHTALYNDVRKEQKIIFSSGKDISCEHWLIEHMASVEPSAEEIAMFREMIDNLASEELKKIVILRIDGKTYEEIAQELGYKSGEVIRQKIKRIEQHLKKYLENGSNDTSG